MTKTRRMPKLALSPAFAAWVTENALAGVTLDDLIAALEEQGVPSALAEREVRALLASPLFAGARRVAARAARYELVARLDRETTRLAPSGGAILHRSALGWDEFLRHHYATGVPVVLTDILDTWPALAAWTPASLKARCGDAEVDVVVNRDGDPACDAHHAALSRPMRFAELCDRVTADVSTNDFYLIANNEALRRPAFAPLLDDVRAPHPLLDASRDANGVSLWMGPRGTVTPLHHDTSNVLFCQVFGKKRFRLYRRTEVALTASLREHVYSPFDPEHPDVSAHPAMADIEPADIVLSPGEALFIPIGAFHHVRALGPSISLSFIGFRAANRFVWYYPGGAP